MVYYYAGCHSPGESCILMRVGIIRLEPYRPGRDSPGLRVVFRLAFRPSPGSLPEAPYQTAFRRVDRPGDGLDRPFSRPSWQAVFCRCGPSWGNFPKALGKPSLVGLGRPGEASRGSLATRSSSSRPSRGGFLCFGLGKHMFFNVVVGGLWPGKMVDHVLFLYWARALENIGCSMPVLVFLASGHGKHWFFNVLARCARVGPWTTLVYQ